MDNGAYPHRLGYARPTMRFQACPTPPESDFVDNGAVTRRLGYAHPTLRQAIARTRAKGVALSDPCGWRRTDAPGPLARPRSGVAAIAGVSGAWRPWAAR